MPPAAEAGCDAPPAFLPARPNTPADLAALTERVRRRVIRWFRLTRLLDAAAAADILAWENSGFSVDASVRITLLDRNVPSYFRSLEHLLRYCARPPFALERLSGPGWERSFRSSARCAAATSGLEETAGRSRLTSNRRFASGRRPGWLRPREVSPSHTSASRSSLRPSRRPGARPPTGVSSCRSMTIAMSFKRRPTSCPRSTSTSSERCRT